MAGNAELRASSESEGQYPVLGEKTDTPEPVAPQEEPPNTLLLKREIGHHLTDLELIDMLKEVDLREKFSSLFRTSGSREVIDPETLQHRLLLCLFGLGTNVGLKRTASQQPGVSDEELLHIKWKFIQKDTLRSAIAQIVNGIMRNTRHIKPWQNWDGL